MTKIKFKYKIVSTLLDYVVSLCRVSVFGLGPLQWICKEWVQKLGSDEATTCFRGEKYTEPDDPTSQGERVPRPRTGTPNSSRIPGALLLSMGLLASFFSALGDLYCYIPLSSVHPPPTLVSHPYPYSSARPIGHSSWRSVSCCGPHRTVQGSHPHQWGQGVNCEYLIRRWQLLLDCFSTMLLWLARRDWNLFWDPQGDCLRRRGAFLSYDFGLPRIGSSSTVHSRSLDFLHSSSGTSSSSAWVLDLKWNGLKPLEPSGPTVYILNLHNWNLFIT